MSFSPFLVICGLFGEWYYIGGWSGDGGGSGESNGSKLVTVSSNSSKLTPEGPLWPGLL